ncbi:MAG: hypothetical protein AAB676_04410 [Verrucomicrobiota bacterium]
MSPESPSTQPGPLASISQGAIASLLLLLAACGQNKVSEYQIPKEKAEAKPAADPHGEVRSPAVKWTLPEGWEEKPAGRMRAASFAVPGPDGQNAEVAIIPMPGLAARNADVVNMWREQLRLEPLGEEAVALQAEKVAIGETEGRLFDMVSKEPILDQKHPVRIIVARMDREGAAWFFKMSGRDEVVTQGKAVFVQFLKSIRFEAGSEAVHLAANHPPVSTNLKESPHPASDKPAWQVPPGWQEQPPTQMLLAKFLAKGQDGTKAEVTVSSFPGEVGGLLANVNRWRSQVSLAPVDQAELSKGLMPLDVSGVKAMLVDVTGKDPDSGQKSRLVGAIVPQGERTWFFKMKGDEPAVEQEKKGFIEFVQSVRFPNG